MGFIKVKFVVIRFGLTLMVLLGSIVRDTLRYVHVKKLFFFIQLMFWGVQSDSEVRFFARTKLLSYKNNVPIR